MNKNEKGISLIALCLIIVFVVIFIVVFKGDNRNNSRSSNNSSNSSSTKTVTLKNREDRSTYIPKCRTIDYKTLARNPEQYKGNNYTFTGQVIQVMEGYNYTVELRVNITPKRYSYSSETYYEDTIYVTYQYSSSTESKILEDDIITIYGVSEGIYTYISVMGSQVSLPKINAMYIDIKS